MANIYNSRLNREQKKCFNRLLKELGIYKLWIRERELRAKKLNVNFWDFDGGMFSTIIDCSLSWHLTDDEYLWYELHEELSAHQEPKEILSSESDLASLKLLCENYI